MLEYTEALEKYRVRYMTRAAMEPGADKQHEHVIPRRVLIAAMLERPSQAEQILRLAVPCIVTREEHLRLNDGGFGWERYQDIDLEVIDSETKNLADLDSLARALTAAWGQLFASDTS